MGSPSFAVADGSPGSIPHNTAGKRALLSFSFQSELLQESNLIMAKLNYVEGDYKEALNIYARVGLDDLPLTAVPPYRLRVLAEAYATKGEGCAVCPGREGVPQGPAVWSQQSLPGACGWTPGPLAGDGLPAGHRAGPRRALGNVRPSSTRSPLRGGETDTSVKFSDN